MIHITVSDKLSTEQSSIYDHAYHPNQSCKLSRQTSGVSNVLEDKGSGESGHLMMMMTMSRDLSALSLHNWDFPFNTNHGNNRNLSTSCPVRKES